MFVLMFLQRAGVPCTSSHQSVITTLLLAVCHPIRYHISVCIADVAHGISDHIKDFWKLDLFQCSSTGQISSARP